MGNPVRFCIKGLKPIGEAILLTVIKDVQSPRGRPLPDDLLIADLLVVRVANPLIQGDQTDKNASIRNTGFNHFQETNRIREVLEDMAAEDHVILFLEQLMAAPRRNVYHFQTDVPETPGAQHGLHGMHINGIDLNAEYLAGWRQKPEECARPEPIVEHALSFCCNARQPQGIQSQKYLP